MYSLYDSYLMILKYVSAENKRALYVRNTRYIVRINEAKYNVYDVYRIEIQKTT